MLWSALKRLVHTPAGLAAVNRLHRTLSLPQKRLTSRAAGSCCRCAATSRSPGSPPPDFTATTPRCTSSTSRSCAGRGRCACSTTSAPATACTRSSCSPTARGSCRSSRTPPATHSSWRAASATACVPTCGPSRPGRLRPRRAPDPERPELARHHGGARRPALDEGIEVETTPVRQVTLDDVMQTDHLVPDVIKIDTEGGELAVLAGAHAILTHARPLVHALRFATRPSPALTLRAFADSPATNFAARPIPPGRVLVLPRRRCPE
ncbi:MAG TPA: FkbM family methyltransferase [Candidatus Acidoferrum sp.]|nr:FkbM family methyltransferase [Candidatus Acidoferrum sp.]